MGTPVNKIEVRLIGSKDLDSIQQLVEGLNELGINSNQIKEIDMNKNEKETKATVLDLADGVVYNLEGMPKVDQNKVLNDTYRLFGFGEATVVKNN